MSIQKLKTNNDFLQSIIPENTLLTFFSKNSQGQVSLKYKDSDGNFGSIVGQSSGNSDVKDCVFVIENLIEGKLVIDGPIPVWVKTDKGNLYTIEKLSLVYQDFVYKINPQPYLAYDNSKVFCGPWVVYCIGGIQGKDGVDGKDGADGKDGKDGTNGINGKDGVDGKDGITPERGIDYWTQDDVDSIKQYVDDSIYQTYQNTTKIQIVSLNNGKITIDDDNSPIAIITNKGNFYPIQKGSMILKDGIYQINPQPYLAYDNSSTFQPNWQIWCVGGMSKMKIVVSNNQPINPIDGMLWIQE